MPSETHERPVAPPPAIEDGPEALIREARRRARRRRMRRAAALAVPLGIAAVAFLARGSGSRGEITETGSRPYVNLHALDGRDEVAFISRGQAWVMDGDRGSLRRLPVPAGDAPSSPRFSHDGRWLAYVVARPGDSYGPSELWIAHGDGSGAHRLRGLTVDQFVGWSPTADRVAVDSEESKRAPYGLPTALDVVAPDGHSRVLFTHSGGRRILTRGAIWSAAWSPDGRSLAVSTDAEAGTQILEVPVTAGSRPTVWLSIPSSQRLTGALGCGAHCIADEAIAQLAGWWPKWGIGFWVFTSGMTRNSDSTPLAVVARPGARPRLIARTLSDGATDAVDAAPGGELALVASSPVAGREYAQGKTVQRCSASRLHCAALPRASTWTGRPLRCSPCFGASARGPGSAVSLDPAWSPGGTLLAYVKAPAYRAAAGPSLTWFRAHQLYVWNPRTDATRRIGDIGGASVPAWSRDGRHLLYVSGDGLWLANASTGTAVEIEHPLYRESSWRHVATTDLAFFGQIPWSTQFSWYAP